MSPVDVSSYRLNLLDEQLVHGVTLDTSVGDVEMFRQGGASRLSRLAGIGAAPGCPVEITRQMLFVTEQHVDDVKDESFDAGSFQQIFCFDALQSTHDARNLLTKCRNWLASDGDLIVGFPNNRYHEALLPHLAGCDLPAVPDRWLRNFEPEGIECLAFRIGLRLKHWTPIRGKGYRDWRRRGGPMAFSVPGLNINVERELLAGDFFTSGYIGHFYPSDRYRFGKTTVVVNSAGCTDTLRDCLHALALSSDLPIHVVLIGECCDFTKGDYWFEIEDLRIPGDAEVRLFDLCCLAESSQIVLMKDCAVVTLGWLDGILSALFDRSENHAIVPTVKCRSSRPAQVCDVVNDRVAWNMRHNRHLETVGDGDIVCIAIRKHLLVSLAGTYSTTRVFSAVKERLFETDLSVFRAQNVLVYATNEQKLRSDGQNGHLLLATARPVISLCMIVRDNEDTLDECLASIGPWVDEIIVVDTGSIDRTIEICHAHGAQVHHFAWCDDFSKARNESFDHANGEWLFWMDSDDVIPSEQGKLLRDLAYGDHDESCFGYVMKVRCMSSRTEATTVVDQIKLVRNRPDLRFEFRIHEQILGAIQRAGGRVTSTDIYVEHLGSAQSTDQRKKKLDRDFRILRLELSEKPDHPFVLFNLGMTCEDAGDFAASAEYLTRCIQNSSRHESHVAKAWALLVSCYSKLGDLSEAMNSCEQALRIYSSDPELVFRHAVLSQSLGHLAQAEQDYKRLLSSKHSAQFRSFDPMICGGKALHNLAGIYSEQGNFEVAAKAFLAAGDDMPRFGASWIGAARALAVLGRRSDLRSLESRMWLHDLDPPSTRWILRSITEEACDEIHMAMNSLQEGWRRTQDVGCLYELARLQTLHQYAEDAFETLQKLKSENPRDASVLYNLGSVNVQLGRFEPAIELFEMASMLEPNCELYRNRLRETMDLVPGS